MELYEKIDWAALSEDTEECLRVLSSLSIYSLPRTVTHEIQSTVHHDAVTHTERVWVTDLPAFDEAVVTGYRCGTCGAWKAP